MRSSRLRLALLAGTALWVVGAPALASTEIGVAAAVNPMAHGFPPAREMRVLQIGSDMVANEKVVTGPQGQAQLLFRDGSALTVGPNSDLVLDSFVYDPETKNGALTLIASRGLLRFVGGQLSKRTPVVVRTATATMGIRGGVALLEIGEGGLNATFLFGDEMTVTSGGETQRVTRPGFAIQAPAGGPPSPPTPVDEGRLAQTLSLFESGGGGGGGVPSPPTDDDVAQTQIAASNSIEALAPAAGAPPLPPPIPVSVPEAVQTEVRNASQDEASEESSSEDEEGEDEDASANPDQAEPGQSGSGAAGFIAIFNPGPPAVLNFGLSVPGTFSGRSKVGFAGIGTSDGMPGFDFPFADGAISGGLFSHTINQSVGVRRPVSPGAFNLVVGDVSLAGWLSPGQDFLLYELAQTSTSQRVLSFAGKPTPAAAFPNNGFTAYQFRRDFVLDSDVPFIRTGGVGYSSAAPAVGYIDWGAARFLLGKVAIEGQGATQRTAASVLAGVASGFGGPGTADIKGRFRGSSRVNAQSPPYIAQNGAQGSFALQRDGAGAGFYGLAGPDYFVLGNGDRQATETGPDGAASYNPNIVAQKTTGTQGARTTATLNGFVGGLAQRIGPDPGVFATTNRYGSPADFALQLDAASGVLTGMLHLNDDSGYGVALEFGGSDAGESAFFDDDTFAATESEGAATVGADVTNDRSFFLTTADAIETIGALPPGVALCECQYLRWGVLGLDVGNSGDPTDRVQLQLAGWVAGSVLSMADLPATGVASYVGHVFGNVHDGTSFYSAFGGLQVDFNFGAPTSSTVNVSNFDGQNYAANLTSLSAGGVFSGSQPGQGPGGLRTFAFKAGFFGGGGGQIPQETGGQFTVTGGGYRAAGIMAGALAPLP